MGVNKIDLLGRQASRSRGKKKLLHSVAHRWKLILQQIELRPLWATMEGRHCRLFAFSGLALLVFVLPADDSGRLRSQ